MKLRQRLCLHEWTDGFTEMEEEIEFCVHCRLNREAWLADQADPFTRGTRWLGGGVALFLMVASLVTWPIQPWPVLAFLLAGALGCLWIASGL